MTGNKQTSQPLPSAKTSRQRGDALRENLSKRKQQARARAKQEKK